LTISALAARTADWLRRAVSRGDLHTGVRDAAEVGRP